MTLKIKIDLPDQFAFTTEIEVRIGDINYGNHVGNDAVLRLVQDARLHFLASHGFSEMDTAGASMIMTDAAIQYKSQAHFADILLIDVAVTECSRIGCLFVYRIRRKDSNEEIARAQTGITFFDYEKNKISRIPEAFRNAVS